MNLQCTIADRIREEFGALWRCSKLGNTLEISTPYRMPDSTLFTLFVTERTDRFIACDGGRIWELLAEQSDIPTKDLASELRSIAKENGMKEGVSNGVPLFFKDCREERLISSIAFDVANFATLATNVLLSLAPKSAEIEHEANFISHAHSFISGHLKPGQSFFKNSDIPGIPIKFNAIVRSVSGLWVFSYVGGNTVKDFRRNASDTAFNFKDVRELAPSNLHLKATVPLLNKTATGYNSAVLAPRIAELESYARQESLTIQDSEKIDMLLSAA